MNIKYLTMARRLFDSDMVPDSTNRANRIKWVKCVRQLGYKWRGLA